MDDGGREKRGRMRENMRKRYFLLQEAERKESLLKKITKIDRERARALSAINLPSRRAPALHEKQRSRGIFKFLLGCGNSAQALVGTQTSPYDRRDGRVCTSVFSEIRRTGGGADGLSQGSWEQAGGKRGSGCLWLCCATELPRVKLVNSRIVFMGSGSITPEELEEPVYEEAAETCTQTAGFPVLTLQA